MSTMRQPYDGTQDVPGLKRRFLYMSADTDDHCYAIPCDAGELKTLLEGTRAERIREFWFDYEPGPGWHMHVEPGVMVLDLAQKGHMIGRLMHWITTGKSSRGYCESISPEREAQQRFEVARSNLVVFRRKAEEQAAENARIKEKHKREQDRRRAMLDARRDETEKAVRESLCNTGLAESIRLVKVQDTDCRVPHDVLVELVRGYSESRRAGTEDER